MIFKNLISQGPIPDTNIISLGGRGPTVSQSMIILDKNNSLRISGLKTGFKSSISIFTEDYRATKIEQDVNMIQYVSNLVRKSNFL